MDSSNSVPKRELDALAQERESFLARMGKHEKARIIKNVVIVSIAFMLHFTAFHGTANLQSSIHEKAGTYSLLSIYGSLMITNIFLPVVVIRWGGVLWLIVEVYKNFSAPLNLKIISSSVSDLQFFGTKQVTTNILFSQQFTSRKRSPRSADRHEDYDLWSVFYKRHDCGAFLLLTGATKSLSVIIEKIMKKNYKPFIYNLIIIPSRYTYE